MEGTAMHTTPAFKAVAKLTSTFEMERIAIQQIGSAKLSCTAPLVKRLLRGNSRLAISSGAQGKAGSTRSSVIGNSRTRAPVAL